MSKKMVTTVGGKTFEVDTSPEACERFGLLSGTRIVASIIGTGTVVGVSPENEDSDELLWIAFKKDGGEKVRCIDRNNISDIYPI